MRSSRLPLLVLFLAAFSLIWGIGSAGLWAPHEVSVAELARRIALNLLGGSQDLRLAGADNSLPIRADLARGELPFTSVALGFRWLGLSEWSGRLPLALWAVLGLGAIYAALARLADRRVAAYSVLVLATSPLYFLQARTLLGDAATLGSYAIAWSGCLAAALASRLSLRARVAYALLGGVGLLAGFWCRGALASVAAPALSVALAAILTRPAVGRFGRAFTLGLLALGVAALGLGLAKLLESQGSGAYSVFVGSAEVKASTLPTFDALLSQLGHGLYPWSACLPLLAAGAFAGFGARAGEAETEQLGLRVAAWLGFGSSFCASSWLSLSVGVTPLPGVACFAVLVGLALRELEETPFSQPLLGFAVAALALILGFDLRSFPEKSLAGFVLSGASLPESMELAASRFWSAAAALFALGAAASLYERDTPEQPLFRREEYAGVLSALQRVWAGNLVFGALLLEAALVGFLLLSALSERVGHLQHVRDIGSFWRTLAATTAVALPLSALLPLGLMGVRDAFRAIFSGRALARVGARAGLAPTRPQGVLAFGAAIGVAASLGFYPALAQQIAPKEVFDRYRALSAKGEPLGMIGAANEAASYGAGPNIERFDEPGAAFEWLTQSREQRRWLVVRRADLSELNRRYRAKTSFNLPVLDARSSEVLLASNRRAPREPDENPLARYVLDAPPQPQHPLHAALADKLDVLGWSLVSEAGEPVTFVSAGVRSRLILYYRVTGPMSGGWQTFVHVDGFQRRFNADHATLDGKYPMSHWLPGDIIADATELLLEPNFTPGSYRLYFGMFVGSRRLEVTRGAHEENRIVGGELSVR